MRPVTPRGFRDVLPREAAERESIAQAVSGVMSAWSYGLVETPVAEEYATLEAGVGSSLEGTAFRLFDSDGQLLALRPEMTVPIARLAATRLAAQQGPYRLRYVSEVFREQASMRGQARQFTQVGLELIGASGPAADAEVIAVLVEALCAAGLNGFSVGVGTVEVLRSIIDAAGMDAAWARAVLAAAHERNLVAIDALAQVSGVSPEAARALRAVPRIRGTRAAIDECRRAAQACGAERALDALDETWDLLEVLGVAEQTSIDFGIMRSFDYYTGIVLEVYAEGLGLPVGGGGRYDGVMAEFETPMPAAGFAVGIERLHIALSEQGATIDVSCLDAILGGEPRETFAAARSLREAGWSVRISERSGTDLLLEAQQAGASESLLASEGRIIPLDSCGEPGPAWGTIPAPPARAASNRGATR